MDKKMLIKETIREFQEDIPIDLFSREISLPTNLKKIITVSGVRRSGKTYLLYKTINELVKNGLSKQNILFFNFDDERFNFETDEFDLILQAWNELYPDTPKNDVYLFFDEIQNTNGWEKFVGRIYNTFSKNIFISGSNSKMLSTDIATNLRGRSLSFEVFPLSFSEYLDFKGIDPDYIPSAKRAKIINQFYLFLEKGGFPEIAMLPSADHKRLLQNYYFVMLYKDIIERYGITNVAMLKYYIRRVLANLTKPLSISKIYNEMKSAGLKSDKNQLYLLSEYFETIYLVFRMYKFDYKIYKEELTDKKQYFIDNGFIHALSSQLHADKGKLLENSIFLWLRSKKSMGLHFYKGSKECDFVLFDRDKPEKLVQACWNVSSPETMKRETAGLAEAAKYFNCTDLTIITAEQEEEIKLGDYKIKIVPAWKEMLKETI